MSLNCIMVFSLLCNYNTNLIVLNHSDKRLILGYMKIPTRLKITKYLLVLSLLGSCISLLTSIAGKGELYPFFYWKLYPQPIGWDHKTTTIRIYAKTATDS